MAKEDAPKGWVLGPTYLIFVCHNSSQGQAVKERPAQDSSGGDAKMWGVPKGGGSAPGPFLGEPQGNRIFLFLRCCGATLASPPLVGTRKPVHSRKLWISNVWRWEPKPSTTRKWLRPGMAERLRWKEAEHSGVPGWKGLSAGERVGGSAKKSGWGRRVSSGEKLATRIGRNGAGDESKGPEARGEVVLVNDQ